MILIPLPELLQTEPDSLCSLLFMQAHLRPLSAGMPACLLDWFHVPASLLHPDGSLDESGSF